MSSRRRTITIASCVLLLGLCTVFLASCGGGGGNGGGGSKFVDIGTSPVGGTFPVVGGEFASVLNKNAGENGWKVSAKGTKGSQENIRSLDGGDMQLALSNASITYFAVRGEGEWDRKYDVKAVMTIAPNVAMFVTPKDSGIKTIADLKGKKVAIGPSGAGFEMFVGPIIEAHGVSFDDFAKKINAVPSAAVDLLGDGNADAVFLGGVVPNGSLNQACASYDLHFIPFDPAAREQLATEYKFFEEITLPKGTYSDLTEDYEGLNTGSMHLITSGKADEEFVYQVTKTIWEHRDEINHPGALKSMTEDNIARDTGTPFHPGAIRFYKEIGVWQDRDDGAATGDSSNGND